MTRWAEDIRATADALTEPQLVRTPLYEWDSNRHRRLTGHHQIVLPGLIAQLYQSVYPAASTGSDGGYSGQKPGSRPPLALEALSTYHNIRAGVDGWCRTYDLTPRATIESTLRQLVAKAISFDDNEGMALLVVLRRWQRWCLVMTGWEHVRAIRDIPCPQCATAGRLRINLTTETAMCHECSAAWAGDDIHRLGDYCLNYRAAA